MILTDKQRQGRLWEVSIHILIWCTLLLFPFLSVTTSNEHLLLEGVFFIFWVPIVFIAITFYSNYKFIIDRYFFPKKKVQFALLNLLQIACFLFFRYIVAYDKYKSIIEVLESPRRNLSLALAIPLDVLSFIIPIVFALAIRSIEKVRASELSKKQEKNTRLELELRHLKYQMQPHFFFNSLNTIYGLIDLDQEKAQKAVHDLSKLMRHLLYKSENEFITLDEEIEFLNKYIALNQLRFSGNTVVTTDFPTIVPNISLPPLLFISLVENSFKHGIAAMQESTIHFEIKYTYQTLTFSAINTNFAKEEADLSGSGIGIDNLQKRLDILFPKQYTYTVDKQKNNYIATVTIPYTSRDEN